MLRSMISIFGAIDLTFWPLAALGVMSAGSGMLETNRGVSALSEPALPAVLPPFCCRTAVSGQRPTQTELTASPL